MRMKNLMNKYFLIIFVLMNFSLHANLDNLQNKAIAKNQDCSESEEIIKTITFSSLEDSRNYEEIENIKISKDLHVPDNTYFAGEMQNFIGREITIDNLNKLLRSTEKYYKKHGYPLVIARFQDKEISNGNIKIIVIIATLGEVKAYGEGEYFSNAETIKKIRTEKGQFIRTDKMLTDLFWINQNPFRNTNLIYEKGEKIGETNVILDTEERLPFRPYAGYENTGNNPVGTNRYYAGFNWGKFLGFDNQVNYQYMKADKSKRWESHTLSYILPLAWRNIFKAFTAWVRTKPSVPTSLQMSGRSWQISGRYIIPTFWFGMKHEFILGYDFKRTNNFLFFVSSLVEDSHVDISQFLLSYSITESDKLGVSAFTAQTYLSPGGMTPFNKTSKFMGFRPHARSDYVYAIFNLDRTTKLFANFSWILNAYAQVASGRLLPSEELSLGGYNTIRGYRENRLLGDAGFLIRNEIRTPAIKIRKDNIKNIGEIQFLAFLDYGKAYDLDPNILYRKATALAGTGPGVRYNIASHLTARVDYGIRLRRALEHNKKYKSRWHVGINGSY